MSDRATILVVEDDDQVAEMVAEHLQATLDVNVIRTRNATETIRLELVDPPDLMLTDILLPDGNGLDLIRLVQSSRNYPVLIMTGQPTMGRAIEALRLGVKDLFTKPFDLQRLTKVAQKSLTEYREQKRSERHAKRLKHLVRKVIDERKSLQERVDLVCKDLVGAYRDLAKRVVKLGQPDQESQHQN